MVNTDKERARIEARRTYLVAQKTPHPTLGQRTAATSVAGRKTSRIVIAGRKTPATAITAQHTNATVVGSKQPPRKLEARQ
jgi:hypothetical protein